MGGWSSYARGVSDRPVEGSVISGGASSRPPEALRPYVTQVAGYCYQPGPFSAHRGMPSTALTVVLAFGQPLDVGRLGQPETQRCFWAAVSGLSVGPAHIRQVGPQEGIWLAITPAGARLLFGLPAATLHDAVVSVEDVLGGRAARWYDEVASATGWPARFAALEQHLLTLAAESADTAGAVRPEVAQAWSRLTEGPGGARVADVADEVGWSRRHLGEQFRAETGVSPRDARRLARFERSHAMARRRTPHLADVAAACGFADQAHMTREWRDLCAYTPGEWMRAELPFLQDRSDEDGDAGDIRIDQSLKES